LSNIFRTILRNASTRVILMIFGFIVSITFYFLTTGYYTQLDLYEKGELEKLSGISKTTSIQIDGMQHQLLFEKYQKKDDIKSNEADSNFSYIQRILKNSQEINGIKTPIYTLVYDDSKKVFYYVVKSDNPNYRHEWKEFKPQHVDQYLTGGVVRPYTDENGTWLSSFSPIKNNKGEVVGLVQVDSQFDEFIQRTWDEIKFRGLISISIISVIGFLLLRSIRGILRKEEEQANEIMQSHSIIEQKNKDITDSINYAKRIQEGILPPHESINLYIPDSFLIFRPRDIVSGDFYWFAETKEHFLLATVDCTGHGVPGGFMSMIGHTLLNEIVNQKGIEDPGKILDLLDIGVKKAIKSKDETESKDGMDVALLSFTKDLKTVQFAGAFRPLLFMREGILSEYKANRFPIGAGSYVKTAFDTHTIHLQKGDALYIFSDGYADQIGGKGGKKFMTKQFKELIQSNNQLDMQKQGMVFELALDKWQGEQEQMDDILVIGIRI
jgi:serine phosphatase RsbU (regulator of sigma subunit)